MSLRSRRRGIALGLALSSKSRKQQAAAQPAPTAQTANVADDGIAQLKQLAELKDQGILTQEEFDAKKKQILGL